MVAPRAGFRGLVVSPFIDQNVAEDQKTKILRCKTSWFLVRKYVMTKKKSKVFAYQSVVFLSQKKNKPKWCHPKMVTLEAGRPPPPLATPLIRIPAATVIALCQLRRRKTIICSRILLLPTG